MQISVKHKSMIDEIPDYGPPRQFGLTKWNEQAIRDLNIPRCGACGKRVDKGMDGKACDVCERMATVIQGD
jgi:hypothetical protein